MLQFEITSMSSLKQIMSLRWCEKQWFKMNYVVFTDHVRMLRLWINQFKTLQVNYWRNGWIQVQGSQHVHGTFWNVSDLSWNVMDCCLSFSRKSLSCLPTLYLKVNFLKALRDISLCSVLLYFWCSDNRYCAVRLAFFQDENVSLLKWQAEKSKKFRLNTIVLTDCAPWRAVSHIKCALYLD